ncbi:uncharacterized protein [Lolium perenne]|uniref:uncharacterized protein n=1 Tax=Lolium perenne TaxID=4522 RepID=UPI0021EAB56D|nr:uncharacterized protein LOC127306421 [Lolium perenne]
MAKGGAASGGGAVKTALVVGGGLILAWITVESAFKPFLDRLRAAVSRSTDPARDPDDDVPDDDKAPSTAAVAAAVADEKEPAAAAAEPSAPPLPADAEEEIEQKGEEGPVPAKAE